MEELNSGSTSYSPSESITKLVNNPLRSDVTFLIGEGKDKVYGHQFILSIGSPVFEKMFYGDIKSNIIEPIEITDLELNGFMNMIKYIYGCEMDIDEEDIAASFLAADKYLVYKFREELSDYLKEIADSDNCIGIYDQLNKIKCIDDVSECLPFEYFDNMIEKSTSDYFENDLFLQISQDSLIEILKKDTINVSEIVLLKACVNWVDEEVERKHLEPTTENTRKIFEPLKQFICFSQIDEPDLKEFKKIQHYLDPQDFVDFFMNSSDLLNSSRLNFIRKRRRLESPKIELKLPTENRSNGRGPAPARAYIRSRW